MKADALLKIIVITTNVQFQKTERKKIHNGIAMETVIIVVCLHRCEESE